MRCVDPLGNVIQLPLSAKRIVCLVPSLTELLYSLALTRELKGITKFCPERRIRIRSFTVVGGTKKVHYDRIKSLQPDLIIANKEANTPEIVSECQKIAPVYVSNVNTLDEAYDAIRDIALLCDREEWAENLINRIHISFIPVKTYSYHIKTAELCVAYLIWKKPYMVAASGTFINNMLEKCGFKNAFAHRSRYPEVKLEELVSDDTIDYLFLSSEPYPFKENDVSAFAKANKKAILVDGQMFSWYGSKLQESPAYFIDLIKSLSSPAQI